MKRIYFDHSATTPVDPKVLKAMLPYFTKKFGNPSSLHAYGQEARNGIDLSRAQAADFLNCTVDEVIFTSGSTESNNLAIRGLVAALKKQGHGKLHIITSVIEHDAVLEPFIQLEREGVEVTYIPVKSNCLIDLDRLKKSIKDNTALISIMYVNSEIGAIQPIPEIGKIIKNANLDRAKAKNSLKIHFHSDATQGLNFCDCDVRKLGIDLLSMSAHKIYGPKGVGALFVKAGVPILPLQLGGHHEKNRRSGTLNTAGIVGLGAALKLLTKANIIRSNRRISALRDRLVKGILKNIPDAVLNTDRSVSTPAHAHFSFLGVEGESILLALDLAGVAVSTGSACASGSLKASHVLLAMGIAPEVAHSSIRFTLGKNNTAAEIDRLIKILPPIVARFRRMAPKG